ncbi:NAD(P)/FAD-dependent oxidoreductase [Streptomyces sp. NPDC001982]|uniref:flavin-containing monooxygenase n=1 Tax=Streptomyces sp. NPDC001982 TaxID=3154405 RepID=UPI0033202481
MPTATPQTIRSLAESWMADLESALARQDEDALTELFLPASYWRDLAALTWDVRQYWGRDEVLPRLLEYARAAQPSGFVVAADRSAPRILDGDMTEFFIGFRTVHGTGSALVVAELDETAPHGLRARLIASTLTGLITRPAPEPTRRGYVPSSPGETWAQSRTAFHERCDTEPEVLVLGGAQSGVMMGARLEALGVPYVVVDKQSRTGDTWRGRYDALALHTPTYANDMPYVRQPDTFPDFLSKDQWADYLDSYTTMMGINRWGDTEFLSGTFDEQERRWTIRLRMPDGEVRVLFPRHLVTALGYTGTEPRIPDLPGLADFAGTVLHSSLFHTGADYAGKRVLVVGSATSGHDIALDLADHGATVHMGQRGPSCVVPVAEAENFNVDYTNPALTVEEIDQRRNSNFVFPLLLAKAQQETVRTEREYGELFDGLRKAGMQLTIGEEKAGWIYRLHKTFSGYYLDVGASQAIIEGRISIVQMADIERFVEDGVLLRDRRHIALDAIVLATGYRNVQHTVERLLGPEIAERVGAIGGVADDGEHRNLARPTGQPHLWMIFGGIMDARKMSEVLALQIAAQIDGLAPSLYRAEDGGLTALEPGDALLEAVS